MKSQRIIAPWLRHRTYEILVTLTISPITHKLDISDTHYIANNPQVQSSISYKNLRLVVYCLLVELSILVLHQITQGRDYGDKAQ